MIDVRTSEKRYFDALARIARDTLPVEKMRKEAEKSGLDYEEFLEMAWENVQSIAKAAIHKRRRPTA